MRPKDIKESALAADVVSRARAASPITDPGEIVETRVIGHRPPHYPGESKDRREIRELVGRRRLPL